MKLHNLKPAGGKVKQKKRLGRGNSSGRGTYCGKGGGGAKSRSGRPHFAGFEGGQMPLYRRLPKRGFTAVRRQEYAIVNLKTLERFKKGTEITPELLCQEGIVRKGQKIKILAEGEINIPLTLKIHKISKKAQEKIGEKGGKVEILPKIQNEKVKMPARQNKVVDKQNDKAKSKNGAKKRKVVKDKSHLPAPDVTLEQAGMSKKSSNDK